MCVDSEEMVLKGNPERMVMIRGRRLQSHRGGACVAQMSHTNK